MKLNKAIQEFSRKRHPECPHDFRDDEEEQQ